MCIYTHTYLCVLITVGSFAVRAVAMENWCKETFGKWHMWMQYTMDHNLNTWAFSYFTSLNVFIWVFENIFFFLICENINKKERLRISVI